MGPSGVPWPQPGSGPSGPPPSGPPARAAAALAWDAARENAVLFSGYIPSGTRADTWTWTLAGGWVARNPAHHPSARAYASIAYDETSRRVILFGGASQEPFSPPALLGDTWAWDGGDWTQLQPARSPDPRVYAALGFIPSLGRLVLTGGGRVGDFPLRDTWAWDGADWAPLPAALAPYGGASVLAYRASDGSTLLLSGASSTAAPLTVSKLEGSNWIELQGWTDPPGERGWAGAAYDPKSETFIVAGGVDNAGIPQSSTWAWHGGWTPKPTGALPAVGTIGLRPAAVWDPFDGLMVLFGGGTVGGLLDGTWTWQGSGWHRVA